MDNTVIINWKLMLTSGASLALVLGYHMQRFVKPIIKAIYYALAAAIFGQDVPPFDPSTPESLVSLAETKAWAAEQDKIARWLQLRLAMQQLFGLLPYYTTLAITMFIVSKTPLRFYPIFEERWDFILSWLSISGGVGFLYDMTREATKWREQIADLLDVIQQKPAGE